MTRLGIFWRRRVAAPLIALLKQGIAPAKLAQTLAAGFVCSMFPILGTTSLLNLVVGIRFRLNHPVMQAMNQLLGPLHLVMIVVYVRLGERVWHMHDDPFTVREFIHACHTASWHELFSRFGWAAMHSITAWAVTAPLFFAVIYYPFRHLFLEIARRRHLASAAGRKLPQTGP